MKKGISLIVLIITIIIMIILAGSIILTLSNSGIIAKANEAVEDTDLAQVRHIATLKWAEAYLDENVTDIKDYVLKGLEDQKIDTSKYIITVTDSGVDVQLKGTRKNEYGFYFDEAYIAEVDSGMMAYVCHGDGSVEIYAQNPDINNIMFCLVEYPRGTATYEKGKIDFAGSLAIVSDDGLSVEMDGVIAKCTLGSEHGIYKGHTYSVVVDSEKMSMTLEEGNMLTLKTEKNGTTDVSTIPVTLTADNHILTYTEGGETSKLFISLDGHNIYFEDRGLLLTVEGTPEDNEENDSSAAEVVHSGTIPAGGTYYVGVTSTTTGDYTGATATYTAGQSFPTTVSEGDVYVYGDYEYRYNLTNLSGWTNYYYTSMGFTGWGVAVLNNTKTTYEKIIPTINNQNVTAVVNTFAGCTSLIVAPVMPDNITNMFGTFTDCTGMTTAPVIPNNVQLIQGTFQGCTNLITYKGSIASQGDFSNYVIPNSVTNMWSTFYGCTALTKAPTIPSGVLNLATTFKNCTALSGNITIKAINVSNYSECFVGTTNSIILVGTGSNNSVLSNLASTADNNNVTY